MGLFSGIGGAISGALGGIAGAVGGVASTILGNNSAKHEAEKNRQWQEQMSNTSISRRMQDLRNSGLNPLLAVENASSGASTPAGSQAQIERMNPAWITALSSAKLQKQQGDVAKAEERKVNAEAEAIENDNSFHEYRKQQLEQEAELRRQGILTEKTVQELNKANSLEAKARILVHQANEKNIKMNMEEAKRKIQLLDIEINKFNNTPVLKTGAFETAKSISSPWNLLGLGVGLGSAGLNSAYQTVKKGFNYLNNLPKVERNIKYRGYREN